jgi:hypothetical protein
MNHKPTRKEPKTIAARKPPNQSDTSRAVRRLVWSLYLASVVVAACSLLLTNAMIAPVNPSAPPASVIIERIVSVSLAMI